MNKDNELNAEQREICAGLGVSEEVYAERANAGVAIYPVSRRPRWGVQLKWKPADGSGDVLRVRVCIAGRRFLAAYYDAGQRRRGLRAMLWLRSWEWPRDWNWRWYKRPDRGRAPVPRLNHAELWAEIKEAEKFLKGTPFQNFFETGDE